MKNLFGIVVLFILSSCAVRRSYNPARKYAPEQLRADYTIFKNILEESHPGLYWYTPKDSVDYYFKLGASLLKDSMPEYKFRAVLSYVVASIKCGHTTVKPSSAAGRYFQRSSGAGFPLSVKAWPDTTVVTANLNQKDTSIMRGVLLQSIDGKPIQSVLDSFFHFLSADGYNTTHKYQTLSNPGVFRSMYNTVYGIKPRIEVSYIDTAGIYRTERIRFFDPAADSPAARRIGPLPSLNKRKRKQLMRQFNRSMRYDSVLHAGFMELNTFSKGNKLRSFFRKSFRQLRKDKLPNLVIDIRGNGGGSVVLSNLLTRYIADKPFKIADSLYAVKRKSSYGKYQEGYTLNHFFLLFMTHKRKDGNYHFSYFENRYFKPKRQNHFNGKVYVLTSGNTFSAASIFAECLKSQENVITVGEETGGGAYGNNAWLIPDIILPNTGVRFRLPLFRLVVDKNAVKGRGVMPKVTVVPTVDAIRRNADFKMEKVIELIKQDDIRKTK